MSQGTTPPGWYHADGDPAGTTRWWDGTQWVGEPQTPAPDQAAAAAPGFGAPGFGAPAMGHTPSLASAGARIGGRILDAIVWIVIGFIVNLPVLSQTFGEAIDAAEENRDPVFDVSPGLIVITGLINLALIVAYEVLLNTRSNGTLGKRAISARIIREDGGELDTRSAVMRMVPYIAIQIIGIVWSISASGESGLAQSSPALLVGLIGLIMLFTDGRRQTPWDKLGKTIVVSR